MRQVQRAGEKLFADYAGPMVPVIDASTGEITWASIFVACLGASSYTFACATPSQTQTDWLAGLSRAMRFNGGVTTMIVPDNPRSLIKNADATGDSFDLLHDSRRTHRALANPTS